MNSTVAYASLLAMSVLASCFLGSVFRIAFNRLRKQSLFFLVICLGFLTSMAEKPESAHTWYVNGTSGDDSALGYVEAKPFKTIKKALASAADGETILVAEGTYREGYTEDGGMKYPNLSVTDGRHLTIRATGARDATIIDGEGQASCLWLNTDQEVNTNVVVEGFTLQNGNGSFLMGVANGGGGAFGGWLKNCRIVDCSADDGGGAWHAKLENCSVEDCFAQYKGAGLYACEADGCRIVGNVISNYDYSVYGAGVYGGTTANSLIACNLIDATCTAEGYGAGAASSAKLINCTVSANTNNAATPCGGGLDNSGIWGSSREYQYNTIFYGNIANGTANDLYINDGDYESYFKNCCTNDPSFKNAAAGDFSLRPTSVCHNAGNNDYAVGTLDCAGAVRIQEGKVDIGAFEYTPIMTITAAPTQATAGTPYSYTLTQTGGAEPIAWSIDEEGEGFEIPEGISLSGDKLTGTPAKGGTYRFRVNATEAGGESQSQIVTMDVLSNYTLHFDGNGNKAGTAPADKALTSIEEYTLPEPGMTCGCARFLGWATNATTAALYQAGDKVKCLTSEPGGNFTLYAAWEDVFIVNFDVNAANVLGGHGSYTNATGTGFYVYTYDGKTNVVDFGSHDAPCRVGWVLHNWNMSKDGTGTKVCEQKDMEWVDSSTFGASRGDTITLYAQWQECIWDLYWADPQLLAGKWAIRVKGDEYAGLVGVSSAEFPADLTLPQTCGGRTVSSYEATLTSLFNRDSVRSITIPEGYTNVHNYAFNYVYSLESIAFPSTLKKIPYYCCQGCTNLASVTFAEGNEIIDGYAFSGCSRLPSVTMPDGLTNVCHSAFYQCTNLTQCVLAGDYIGSTYATYVFEESPIVKLEIPASCVGFGNYALNKTKALRFLGDRPTWDVYGANQGAATLIEFPATNATWNAGKIPWCESVPHKGFVGPISAFGVTDAYFWTNANQKITFAYAESALGEMITIPAGKISWGGVDWDFTGFEADAFAGQSTTTVYYPIAAYAKWESVTPPAGITLAPAPGTYFTLNFHTNGGDAYVPAAMTFPPSAVRALPTAKPTKSGYKFLGWATSASGEVAYQPGDNYTAGAANASATLFARWEDVGNYTIRFQGNSAWATNVPATIVTAVETTPAIPANPGREGWSFNGWTNAVNDHVYRAGDAFDEGCTKGSTFMLYAKWNRAAVGDLSYTDGEGTVWTYDREGDSVTIKSVVPGEDVETLELPESIKGSTLVQKASGYCLPEMFNGLWWNYTELANNCAKLTSVILSGPTDLVMPSTIAGRKVTAFATVNSLVTNRYHITSVDIPGTVETIPSYAFYDCRNLTEIVLHEGTVSIGSDAFGYTALAAPIDFPESLVSVDPAAFRYVDSIPYDADGFMYVDTGKTYLQRVRKDVAYAPEGVKTLANQAFSHTECAKVTVPESVEVYGGSLFIYLTTLREVVFKSPAALSYNAMFYQTSSVTNITLYGGEQEVGSFADSPSHITTVGFLTTPPSWNVTDKFPYATTICYYADYAADWADYKKAHPSYVYVEHPVACFEGTVGHYLEYYLKEDLGVKIPDDVDYLAGDKVTVKIEGLAKGLKLVTTPVKVTVGKKSVISGYVYTIAGVPTEALDFATQAMYARVTTTYKDKTKGKVETLTALKLAIKAQKGLAFPDAELGSNYVASVEELWPKASSAWSFKGWPAGLAYRDGIVYGKPTKAGVYTITATHKERLENANATVTETETAKLTVLYVGGKRPDEKVEPVNDGVLGAIDWEVRDSTVTVMQGSLQTNWNVTVSSTVKVTATGLPTGLKFAFDNKTGKYTLSGTPTKVGNYVVTFKTVQNGVTKTERIAMAVTANAYTGAWYAAPLEENTASWTAYLSVAAGGTVKLALTEGTTNANAKGVVQSQVTKTMVTAKAFDCDGKSVVFTLPKNKKVAGSADRTCVVDFAAQTIAINGKEQCAGIYRQASFDFDVPEVATLVLEEFVEDKSAGNSTNAFAYLTATYNAAKGLVGVKGKLYDGTAVSATTYALADANGGVAPFLVTDKSKNAISITISYTAKKGEFKLMQCAVFVNGQFLRIGKSSLNPSWDGFDAVEAKLLKSTKFSDMTSATNLVVLVDAESSPRQEALTLPIPAKSLATKLTAQGLVTFKGLKDADGISWTCELLPVGEATDGDVPFCGIAKGVWKNPLTRKTETFVCPVRTE